MVTEKGTEKKPAAENGEGEIEGLKQQNQALQRELQARDATVARLEQEKTDRDGQMVELKKKTEDTESRLAELDEARAGAVEAYREQVVRGNPGVLADMITGETIEEIDTSRQQALALIDKVRQEMEAEASNMRIPGGAPARTPVDLTGLSAREKIRYAIGGS